jgi:hypothetical protein
MFAGLGLVRAVSAVTRSFLLQPSQAPQKRRPSSAVGVVGRRPINQRRDDADAQEVAPRPLSQSVVDITYRQGQRAHNRRRQPDAKRRAITRKKMPAV